MWVNAGGTFSGNHDAGNISSTTIIPFGAKGTKIITFGSKNGQNPLPIDLISFMGNCEKGEVIINWETASEINNDYFILEKSIDLVDWKVVTTLDGAGNSNQINNYTITTSGTGYYRLTQVDFDGKRETFPIIMVNCEEDETLLIYPNPTEDEVFFSEEVNYQLFSLDGKLLQTGFGNTLSLGEFSPGIYGIIINNHLYKMIKQ